MGERVVHTLVEVVEPLGEIVVEHRAPLALRDTGRYTVEWLDDTTKTVKERLPEELLETTAPFLPPALLAGEPILVIRSLYEVVVSPDPSPVTQLVMRLVKAYPIATGVELGVSHPAERQYIHRRPRHHILTVGGVHDFAHPVRHVVHPILRAQRHIVRVRQWRRVEHHRASEVERVIVNISRLYHGMTVLQRQSPSCIQSGWYIVAGYPDVLVIGVHGITAAIGRRRHVVRAPRWDYVRLIAIRHDYSSLILRYLFILASMSAATLPTDNMACISAVLYPSLSGMEKFWYSLFKMRSIALI